VIDWVMQSEGVSFRHAVELLREGMPALAASSERVVRQSTVPKLAAPVAMQADDQQLLDQVIDYYRATLKQSPEALAYLEKRGIASSEAIDRFQLGYTNRTLGLRLPEKTRKAGAEIRERLQRLRLIRASGHEHFTGPALVPLGAHLAQFLDDFLLDLGRELLGGNALPRDPERLAGTAAQFLAQQRFHCGGCQQPFLGRLLPSGPAHRAA
jgi:hypothetical protein